MPSILLADESKDFRETLATLLTMKGYQVICVPHREEVLSMIRSVSPQVVLLDVGCEENDGSDMCLQIREEFGEQLPVILTSNDYELLSQLSQYSAVGHLEKPFEFSVLLTKLQVAFSKHSGNE